jgi:hypothetical protein
MVLTLFATLRIGAPRLNLLFTQNQILPSRKRENMPFP